MDWENLFEPQILKRGYDYFDQGLVENFKETKTKITAKVLGSETYDVKIKLKNSEIVGITCTCPYAQDGKYCKHMVAVLAFGTNSTENQDNTAVELVKQASNEQVRDFLTAVLKSDAHLKDLFQLIVFPQVDNDLVYYKKQINDIIAKNTNRQGVISYYEADSFERDMSDFIWGDVVNIFNDQELDLTFDVLGYVAVRLSNVVIDDSDGGLIRLAEYCDTMWHNIIEQADSDLQTKMFNWFIDHYDKLHVFEDILDDLLLYEFNDPEFLKQKLVWSEKRFHDSETSSSPSSYEIAKWAVYHVNVMQKLNLPITEINQFCLENDNYSEVRMIYVDNCIQQKDYSTAVESLVDGKKTFGKWAGTVAKFSVKLKDVYRESGQTDNYLHEMWLILTQYSSSDIDVYREYKQQFTNDEWKVQREKLFASIMEQTSNLNRMFVDDGLWDRLLENVLKSDGLYNMEQYEGFLKKRYPQEVLQKYVDEVQHLASQSGSRGHYRKIVRVLNHIATLDNGYDAAVKIIADWKIKYQKRPAMLDELKGFNQRIY